MVTANRVGDGAVVYRRADGGWTTHLDDAAICTLHSPSNVFAIAGVASKTPASSRLVSLAL